MANSKISALTATTTVGDTDEYVVAVAGATKKITGANLKAAVAPVAGSYVTTAAEGGLSAEKVLGTTVIATGLLSARPAAAVEGYLYLATDVNGGTLYRDTGAAWVQTGSGVRASAFNGQAGVLVPTCRGWAVVATSTLTANRVYLTRFVLPCDFTVTSMKFRSTTVGTGNVDVGIYSGNLTSKLASSGTTAGKKGATTVQTVALSGTVGLTAGTVYYAALITDTSDGTVGGVSYTSPGHELFGATDGLAEGMFKDAGAYPLPSSAASATATTSLSPVMALI